MSNVWIKAVYGFIALHSAEYQALAEVVSLLILLVVFSSSSSVQLCGMANVVSQHSEAPMGESTSEMKYQ